MNAKFLTNEQAGDVNRELETIGESVSTAVDILNLSPDAGMILIDLHEAQDKLNRLVAQLEDIVNG